MRRILTDPDGRQSANHENLDGVSWNAKSIRPKATYIRANKKPFRTTRPDTLQMHRIETQDRRKSSDNTKGCGGRHWALDMRGRDAIQPSHNGVVMAEQEVERDSETPGAQRGYMPCPTPRLQSPTWV